MQSINDEKKYINSIHPRLIAHLLLSIELRINQSNLEIREYDIQEYMRDFLGHELKNTPFGVKLEAAGKIDCIIQKKDEAKPAIVYELKSYFKSTEVPTHTKRKKDVEKDLIKLVQNISPETRGFFILAINREILEKLCKTSEGTSLDFIRAHYQTEKKPPFYSLTLEDGQKIVLRPSIKQVYRRTAVFSWEVTLKK